MHWKDNTHLPYLIGGRPSIANAFIRYLNDITGSFGGYKTWSDAGSDSSTESLNEISKIASESTEDTTINADQSSGQSTGIPLPVDTDMANKNEGVVALSLL